MMHMELRDYIWMGLEGLTDHKVRSLLTMLGIILGVASVIAMLSIGEGGYNRLELMLNRGDEGAKMRLERLPGFISSDRAVMTETSKRDALQAMEELNLDNLPVIDSTGRFIGTVERAKLTTSLILAITEKLSEE